jgi:CRISPR type I-E-associated protein CasB/Cse2
MTDETQTAARQEPSRAERFIEDVRAMYGPIGGQRHRRGDLAMLKRNTGNALSEARGVAWFYGFLAAHGVAEYQQETHFLIATLMAADRRFLQGRAPVPGNFGQTCRALAQQHSADSVERRFRILLDAALEEGGGEMPFRLRQMTRLCLSKEVTVDWARLLEDLLRWNLPGKRVRKQWAQRFYAPLPAADRLPDATPDSL